MTHETKNNILFAVGTTLMGIAFLAILFIREDDFSFSDKQTIATFATMATNILACGFWTYYLSDFTNEDAIVNNTTYTVITLITTFLAGICDAVMIEKVSPTFIILPTIISLIVIMIPIKDFITRKFKNKKES